MRKKKEQRQSEEMPDFDCEIEVEKCERKRTATGWQPVVPQ